jgi:alpha-L-fucosidase
VYAIVKTAERWKYGEWRDLVLRSVRATPRTEVSVLGQSGEVLEYQPSVVPRATWKQAADGLHVRAMRAQRIYNDRKWPNPVVLRLTNVEPALQPPVVVSSKARGAAGAVTFEGDLRNLGGADAVEVGFEYRNVKGLDMTERPDAYRRTPYQRRTQPGSFTAVLKDGKPGDIYEWRAVVKHPLITTYGKEQKLPVR